MTKHRILRPLLLASAVAAGALTPGPTNYRHNEVDPSNNRAVYAW